MLLLAQCTVVVSTFFYLCDFGFYYFAFHLMPWWLNGALTAFMSVIASVNMNAIYYFFASFCALGWCQIWSKRFLRAERVLFCTRWHENCTRNLSTASIFREGLLVWWFWCFVFVSQLPLVVWTGWKHFQKMLSLLRIFYFQMYFCYPLAVLVKAKACDNLHKMIFDAFVRSCLWIYSAFVGIWLLVHCFHFQFSCQSKWQCLHSPIAHMHPYTKSIHENINTFYWTR